MIGRLSTLSMSASLAFFAVALFGMPSRLNAETADQPRTAPHGSAQESVRVAEVVQGVRVEVSVVAMDVRPLIVVTFGMPQMRHGELSLEDQALALDHALGRLERDKHLPPRFDFQPGSIRPALLSLLDARLSEPDANWSGRTGTSLHGNVYKSLSADVLAIAKASPLAAAFAHHGYTLETRGTVGRVEIGKAKGFGSTKLPIEIGEMGLVASRK